MGKCCSKRKSFRACPCLRCGIGSEVSCYTRAQIAEDDDTSRRVIRSEIIEVKSVVFSQAPSVPPRLHTSEGGWLVLAHTTVKRLTRKTGVVELCLAPPVHNAHISGKSINTTGWNQSGHWLH